MVSPVLKPVMMMMTVASLRNNPSLVAEWLSLGDKLGLEMMKDIVMTVYSLHQSAWQLCPG